MTEVTVEIEGHHLRLSSLDKVLYPATGTTKGEVLDYYARIATVLLPHLQDRAVTRIRWPDGVEGESFFEKNSPAGTPPWVRTVDVPTSGSRGGSGEPIRFPVVTGLRSLMWLINLAAIELHVHQWREGDDGLPADADRLVIDLDPGAPAGLKECCETALEVRSRLHALGMAAAPVTSGGKGLHLYAQLPEPMPPSAASKIARDIAEALTNAQPTRVTATMAKAQRVGKVFLDWSQNSAAKTTVSPYSMRGRERPTVATPVTWEEIEAGAADADALEQFTFDRVLARVETHGDLIASFG